MGGFSDNVRLGRENNIENPQDQLMMIMGLAKVITIGYYYLSVCLWVGRSTFNDCHSHHERLDSNQGGRAVKNPSK